MLFYVNDSVGLTKKRYFSRSLCYATIILALHHCTGSQRSASRGHGLAFYRIAPCLRITPEETDSLIHVSLRLKTDTGIVLMASGRQNSTGLHYN